jgi:hypothetical protein
MRRCRRALLISFYERFLQSFQMCGPRGQRPLFRAVQGIRDSGCGIPAVGAKNFVQPSYSSFGQFEAEVCPDRNRIIARGLNF